MLKFAFMHLISGTIMVGLPSVIVESWTTNNIAHDPIVAQGMIVFGMIIGFMSITRAFFIMVDYAANGGECNYQGSTLGVAVAKQEKIFAFSDKELNEIHDSISAKAAMLLKLESVKNDASAKYTLEAIGGAYLKKVANEYHAVPTALREKEGVDGKTPRQLVMGQLDMLSKSVDKIENELFENQLCQMRVTDSFFKEKFDKDSNLFSLEKVEREAVIND